MVSNCILHKYMERVNFAMYENRYSSVTIPTKSMSTALILTFLFGPLGMLYFTVLGALFMLGVTIITFLLTDGAGLLIIWPIMLIWTAIAINIHNKKVFNRIFNYQRTTLKRRALSL